MSIDAVIQTTLRQGLVAMHIPFSEQQVEQLLQYITCLLEWRTAINLTAIRDPLKIAIHHLLDSLSLVPYLQGTRILDVGSGAGLPGIPLAIMAPTHQVILLDKKLKSVQFLRQAVHTLGLKNTHVIHSPVESYQPSSLFPCVVSRAVFAYPTLATQVVALLEEAGTLLAMQGKWDPSVSQRLPSTLIMEAAHRVQVFSLEGERHVVICRKK